VIVRWSENAENNLDDIYDYIAQDSVRYAQETVDRLTSCSGQIGSFPYSGREVPEYATNDLREIIEPPYRIIYYIDSDFIEVVAVVHSAQKLDKIQKH